MTASLICGCNFELCQNMHVRRIWCWKRVEDLQLSPLDEWLFLQPWQADLHTPWHPAVAHLSPCRSLCSLHPAHECIKLSKQVCKAFEEGYWPCGSVSPTAGLSTCAYTYLLVCCFCCRIYPKRRRATSSRKSGDGVSMSLQGGAQKSIQHSRQLRSRMSRSAFVDHHPLHLPKDRLSESIWVALHAKLLHEPSEHGRPLAYLWRQRWLGSAHGALCYELTFQYLLADLTLHKSGPKKTVNTPLVSPLSSWNAKFTETPTKLCASLHYSSWSFHKSIPAQQLHLTRRAITFRHRLWTGDSHFTLLLFILHEILFQVAQALSAVVNFLRELKEPADWYSVHTIDLATPMVAWPLIMKPQLLAEISNESCKKRPYQGDVSG